MSAIGRFHCKNIHNLFVNLDIQSVYRKIWTWKISVFEHFSRMEIWKTFTWSAFTLSRLPSYCLLFEAFGTSSCNEVCCKIWLIDFFPYECYIVLLQQKQPAKVFYKRWCSLNSAKFIGKHLCQRWEIFENTIFTEQLRVTASVVRIMKL